MKTIRSFFLGAVCANLIFSAAIAQDNDAARATAAREAAEERYKQLNSAVENLVAAQASDQRKLAAMAEEIRSLRAQGDKVDTSKFVTRDELNRLVKTIEEIEQKRDTDKKLIEDEFEQLKKDIVKLLNSPSSAPAPRNGRTSPAPDRNIESRPEKTDKPAAAVPNLQEGVWYVIQPKNTLSAVAAAHNEEFNKQGKKTSVELIQSANPGIKPTSLQPGQKIFVPLVPQ